MRRCTGSRLFHIPGEEASALILLPDEFADSGDHLCDALIEVLRADIRFFPALFLTLPFTLLLGDKSLMALPEDLAIGRFAEAHAIYYHTCNCTPI